MLQNHQCHDCGRQFVACFEPYLVSDETRGLSERLLLECRSLRGICRAVGGGLKWLLGFMVTGFDAWLDHLHVQPISCPGGVLIQRLGVEADEMFSFVKQKANQQWIWLAMGVKTRQLIAFHVGDRSRTSAQQLEANIPRASRQQATFYTDQDVVSAGVIPPAQHQPSRRKPVKPSIWSASPTPCASEFHGWSARRYRSPKISTIISVPSNMLFATTT